MTKLDLNRLVSQSGVVTFISTLDIARNCGIRAKERHSHNDTLCYRQQYEASSAAGSSLHPPRSPSSPRDPRPIVARNHRWRCELFGLAVCQGSSLRARSILNGHGFCFTKLQSIKVGS